MDKFLLPEAFAREPDIFITAIENAGCLFVVLDRQGHIVLFNRACEQMTGYSVSEVRGKRFWELFLLPDDIEQAVNVFSRLNSKHFPYTLQQSWQTYNGILRTIAWRYTVVQADDGWVRFVIACGYDVTEQHEAEERFNTVFEHTTLGLVITDLENRIISCNSAFALFLGYRVEELRQVAHEHFVCPDDAAQETSFFQELIAGQRINYQLEQRYIHKRGSVVQGRLTAALVRDAARQPQNCVKVIEDRNAYMAMVKRLDAIHRSLRHTEELLNEQQVELARLKAKITDQEWAVLDLLSQGLSNREISQRLPVSVETVKSHIHHIGKKLGLPHGGRQAVLFAAMRNGIIQNTTSNDSYSAE